ncbi:MAG: hypothetical protein NC394_04905 [Bacteroides sp.]|nr:hypothetical protein [Bacteroides sp.]
MEGAKIVGIRIFSTKYSDAERTRFKKIYRLTSLLCSEDINVSELENTELKPFKVGGRIRIDGEDIYIKNKLYSARQLQRITINTEGSMRIYDRYGKKLCGSFTLNLSSSNIELFCIWARKYNVPGELVSGKGERTLQKVFLTLVFIIILFVKVVSKII